MSSNSNNVNKLDRHQILGADGKTMVYVYDGLNTKYISKGKFKNYAYYLDDNGKKHKTRPYGQYTSMTNRCLKDGSHQKNYKEYKGVSLSEDFYNFDDWVSWAETKVGFMCLDNNGNLYQQDKDLLGCGKIYSKENCCFVEPRLNGMLKMFNKEVSGVRVTSQGTFQVLCDDKLIPVRTKAEATHLAFKRDVVKFKNYIFDNFSTLDEDVIEVLLGKLKILGERDVTLVKEKAESKLVDELNTKFMVDLNAVTVEKPNSEYPNNIKINRKMSGDTYVVQMTFKGKTIFETYRKHFKTFKEAEEFQVEEKLKLIERIYNDYNLGGKLNEKSVSKFFEIKNFLEHKSLMLGSGLF